MSFYEKSKSQPDLSSRNPANDMAKTVAAAEHVRSGVGTVPEAVYSGDGHDRMISDVIAQHNHTRKPITDPPEKG